MKKTSNLIGLKELREKTGRYIKAVEDGKSFTVVRRSRPVFRITPIDDEDMWETVVDFTKLRRGGLPLADLLARL